MSYRANKVHQAKGIKRHEYSESRRRQLPLDPKPYQCTMLFSELRHADEGWCGYFDPRPGYEQDRSKYEH